MQKYVGKHINIYAMWKNRAKTIFSLNITIIHLMIEKKLQEKKEEKNRDTVATVT